MNIQNFCAQMQDAEPGDSTFQSLRQLAHVDLKKLMNSGALAATWPLWNPDLGPWIAECSASPG